MKKAIVLTLSVFFFGAVAVQAQNQTEVSTTNTEVVKKVAEKSPVKKEELPQAVNTTLASDEYKGWEFATASLVKEEGNEYYEINLKQAEKTVLVKLNKEGKKVD